MMYGFLDVNMKFTPLDAFDLNDHQEILLSLVNKAWPNSEQSLLKALKKLTFKNEFDDSLVILLKKCEQIKQPKALISILLPHAIYWSWHEDLSLDNKEMFVHLKNQIARLQIFRDHIPEDELCYRAQLLECLQTCAGISISGEVLEQLFKLTKEAVQQLSAMPALRQVEQLSMESKFKETLTNRWQQIKSFEPKRLNAARLWRV